jgi:hypothetical protein
MQGGFDVNGAKLGPVLPPPYAIRVFLLEICGAAVPFLLQFSFQVVFRALGL